MKKFFKTLATVSMIALLSSSFIACSTGSDDDDDDSTTSSSQNSTTNGSTVKLPASKGTNELKGKTIKNKYADVTLAFKDDTYTETKPKDGKTAVEEYKYSYDSERGLITYNLLSVSIGEKKITSMKEFYAYYAKAAGVSEEFIKTMMGDIDMFSLIGKASYYILPNGNIVMGEYFTGEISLNNFEYSVNGEEIELAEGDLEWDNDSVELDFTNNERSFSGDNTKGTISKVELPAKTLKELRAEDPVYMGALDEKNGYVLVKFENIPTDLAAAPYNLQTSTDYKFIFNPGFEEFELK